VRRAARAGEPFVALAAAADEREALSRAQIGPAILLYRVLRERIGAAEALRITGEVAAVAGCAFMREQLGPLDRSTLAALDADSRQAFAADKSARFFNADVTWESLTATSVAFTVTRCAFPPLCAATGVPELASIFCAVDERYFATVEPDVALTRPTTIAGGDATCAFGLHYR
jgi:hypothetical protein